MPESRLAFSVEVGRTGVRLGAAAAGIAACVEDAYFNAVLLGHLPNAGAIPDLIVSPTWAEGGPPHLAGLTLSDGNGLQAHYGLEVFAARARALIGDLLRERVVEANDSLHWSVIAAWEPVPSRRLRARAVRAPYPFHTEELAHLQPGALAVELEPDVVAEIEARTAASSAVECAGLLVGRLSRDPERRAAALRITRQLPIAAGRRGASNVHFAFGPESFRSARERLASSGDGAIAAGWWHSHPPCEDCPRRQDCRADTVFFSADDVQVHASAFGAAYMIAAVAGKVRDRPAAEPGVRVFGWQSGVVVERPLADLHAALAGATAGERGHGIQVL